jgi:hypothetical protein
VDPQRLPDLTDALAAYRHFLDGDGRPRIFSYDRYVMIDRSGQLTLRNAISSFKRQRSAYGLSPESRFRSKSVARPSPAERIRCGFGIWLRISRTRRQRIGKKRSDHM